MEVKYDKIGTGYNLTRKADKYLADRLFYHLNPKHEGLYLDIGCGTGNYTHELQTRGFHFIGIDPSQEMLKKAIQKNDAIDWRLGAAEKTNLKDESVDGIMASLTLHHWSDLYNGFKEMYRVLRNKGRIVIFTSTPSQMKGYWLNHYFPKMLDASIRQMPSFEIVEEAMTKAGFSIAGTELYFIKPDLEDLFLYCGKQNPELYLKPEVRQGISSFSSLAIQEEVNLGLQQLKQDIESGKIKKIMKSYENDLGDYLFIVAEK